MAAFRILMRVGITIDRERRTFAQNLLRHRTQPNRSFPVCIGYETPVIPQIVNALLSRTIYSVGFTWTRRRAAYGAAWRVCLMRNPCVADARSTTTRLRPICRGLRDRIAAEVIYSHCLDARTFATWKKLGQPDVTMADIIGDVDTHSCRAWGRDLSDELTIITAYCRAPIEYF